jgi:general secretion pathway protein F
MANFRYQAYDLHGNFAAGIVEAASDTSATSILWSRGLTPFRLTKADRAEWWRQEIRIGSGSQTKELTAFTRKFATLRNAEIPLDDALGIVLEQSTTERTKTLLADLRGEVLNGAALSEAMERRGTFFPADYVSMVRAGEIGGTEAQVIADLAELLERRLAIQAGVTSALIYPSLLIVLSIAAVFVLINALIPSLAPIFQGVGKPLPMAMSLLLEMQQAWLQILIAMCLGIGCTAFVWSVVRRRPSTILSLDRRKLALPLIGRFLLEQETARLARTLGMLLKAGVPLATAARATQNVVRNRWLAHGIDRTIEALQRGVALHRALGTETSLPAVALQMISVGEASGKLDHMLLQVAALYERQTQTSIDRFMSVLTPMLTVGIALLIGAMMLPIMDAVLSINDLVAQ